MGLIEILYFRNSCNLHGYLFYLRKQVTSKFNFYGQILAIMLTIFDMAIQVPQLKWAYATLVRTEIGNQEVQLGVLYAKPFRILDSELSLLLTRNSFSKEV